MDPWGWMLLLSAGAGGLLTVGYLRLLSRRRRLALVAMLSSGEIVWGAEVRQVVGRVLGVSGALVAKSDGQLVLEPDAASVKRGARTAQWPLSETMLRVGPWRWDITGVRYRLIQLQPGSAEPELRFAAAQMVGELPHQHQSTERRP